MNGVLRDNKITESSAESGAAVCMLRAVGYISTHTLLGEHTISGIADKLDKAYESKPLEDLAAAPVAALQGVSDGEELGMRLARQNVRKSRSGSARRRRRSARRSGSTAAP